MKEGGSVPHTRLILIVSKSLRPNESVSSNLNSINIDS